LFLRPLADSFIFLTLTRLVVVIIFENFSFALFTPSRRLSDSLPDSPLSLVRRSVAPRLVWSLAHCLTGAVVPLLAAWTSIILFTFHFPPILALLLTCSVVRLSLVLGWSLLVVAGRSTRLLLGPRLRSVVSGAPAWKGMFNFSHLILVIVWIVRCTFNSILLL
jgi:hypothetical protein